MAKKKVEELPKIDAIRLPGFDLDIDYYLRKRYDEIGEAAEEVPIIMEYISCKLQELLESKFIAKQKIKEAEGAAYFFLKKGGFEERGYGEKQTEKALEMAVPLEESVRNAYESFSVLNGWVMRLQGAQLNLQLKLDLLRSFEATRRKLIEDNE